MPKLDPPSRIQPFAKILRRRLALVGAVSSLSLLWISAGCSSDPMPDDGTGGEATDSGGTTGSGAASNGDGGNTNSGGGSVSTGGVANTGGDASTGGAATGGAATGGAASGGAGSGGEENYGGMGGLGGMGGMGGVCGEDDFPTLSVDPRDDSNSWGENDFDDVDVVYACGTAEVTAIWPHEIGWEADDPSESNSEQTKFTLNTPYTEDLTGKQLNLTVTVLDDGRGSLATNGGYNIYIGAQDSTYDEAAATYSADVEFYGTVTKTLTYVIPDDLAFDPADAIRLIIRVENKYWDADPQPVFDYDISVFEFSELTVTDAP
jgi:hypothetical protein